MRASVFALMLMAPIPSMADQFYIDFPSQAAFASAACGMGFCDMNGNLVLQGHVPGDPNPMASYAVAVPGFANGPNDFIVIVDINGIDPFISGTMKPPSSATAIYGRSLTCPNGWANIATSTCSPDWIPLTGTF